jgi:LCP family protein required for cell wall assembly
MSPLRRSPQTDHVRRRRSGLALPRWAVIALLALFVVGIIALAYFTFNGVKKLVSNAPLGAGPVETPAAGGGAEGAAPGEEAGVEVEDVPTWEEGRVTVLLMGVDERETEVGPWRTDTMILLTMDPASRSAGMISIPRDLWVEIPDYGRYDRINTAYFRGDADQYPGGGGAALAMKTVQQNLGVTVNYYAVVNFYAFVTIIDEIGCIPIDVPETIDDPDYPAPSGPGYDPFHIDAGEYCLGGETLLKYARTRATFGGDFDRAQRQQQVLYAIRDHVLSTGQLPNLLSKAPQVYATLQDSINTNLTETEIIQLGRLAAEIPEENICSAVISGDYIERFETLPDGSQVVIPNRAKIRQLIVDIYTGTGRCNPSAQDLAGAAQEENADIHILNGTRHEGMATETANRLTAVGLHVIEVGNADRFDYEVTEIHQYGDASTTARYIAALLNLPNTVIVEHEAETSRADIEVVLGSDLLGEDAGE